MRPTIIIMILAVMHLHAPAQQTRFGIKAGLQSNYLASYYEKENKYAGNKIGFHAGAIADFRLSGSFSVQPNLLLVMKGGNAYGTAVNVLAAELPVNFLYRQGGFFIGAGPSVSYGLTGWLSGQPDPAAEKNVFSNKCFIYLKRLDAQANFLMGYSLPGGIEISAHYTQGLLNLQAKEEQSSFTQKISRIALSAGYIINRKK